MVSADFLLYGAGELVTVAGPPGPRRGAMASALGIVRDGALAALDGRIVWCGPTAESAESVELLPGAREFDAEGRTVTPGFVDSHTHPLFMGDRQHEFAMRARGADYEEIARAGGGILNSVERTRKAAPEQLARNLLDHLSVMLSLGSTTIEAKTGYGLDHDTEIRCLRVLADCSGSVPQTLVPTFMGAHEIPAGWKGRGGEYLDYLCGSVLPDVGELAVFVDIFCEEGVFSVEESRRYLIRAAEMGYGLKVHADELHDTGGTGLAVELGAVSADHLLFVSDENVRRIAGSGTVATMLPGTALFLGKPWPPARKLLDAGAAVAVATDFNPGSCFCESMPLMVSLAVCGCGMTVEEALVSATANGAAALGLGGVKGSLEVGCDADFVIWDIDDYRSIPYHLAVPDIAAVFCGAVPSYSRTLAVQG